MKGDRIAVSKREPAIDSAVEKPLLSLHATTNIGSFWRAVQQLLSTAMPNRLIGLMLQPNPILPMIARWTLPMPDGFFTAEPLKSYIAAQQRRRFVRISDLFSNRTSLMKSAFYRRYMAPQRCVHGIGLFFWKRQRLICVIAIMRTVTQGDLSPTEMKLLQHLYPQFLTALCRLRSLEREHSLRMDLEEFLSRLPMPTILLRWNLKLIYQNQAAREFCALWEKGTEEAKQTKATSPIPSEILDRCRLLKHQWAGAQRPIAPLTGFKEERVHHPRSPHLRATVHLKQLSSAGVARPHFLIECEDLRSSAPRSEPARSRLPHLVRLTRRVVQQENCDGFTIPAHTATYIAGISGTAVVGNPVVVDANGQLGTATSSARFKKHITPMEKTSEAILALKPVTFEYKSDSKETPQFGLIAEEVAKVNPDLVVRDRNGDICSVRYEAVNAMLLNEFLKEHRKVEELKKDFQTTVAQQQKEIQALTARLEKQAVQLQRVSAQIQVGKPVPQLVQTNE